MSSKEILVKKKLSDEIKTERTEVYRDSESQLSTIKEERKSRPNEKSFRKAQSSDKQWKTESEWDCRYYGRLS